MAKEYKNRFRLIKGEDFSIDLYDIDSSFTLNIENLEKNFSKQELQEINTRFNNLIQFQAEDKIRQAFEDMEIKKTISDPLYGSISEEEDKELQQDIDSLLLSIIEEQFFNNPKNQSLRQEYDELKAKTSQSNNKESQIQGEFVVEEPEYALFKEKAIKQLKYKYLKAVSEHPDRSQKELQKEFERLLKEGLEVGEEKIKHKIEKLKTEINLSNFNYKEMEQAAKIAVAKDQINQFYKIGDYKDRKSTPADANMLSNAINLLENTGKNFEELNEEARKEAEKLANKRLRKSKKQKQAKSGNSGPYEWSQVTWAMSELNEALNALKEVSTSDDAKSQRSSSSVKSRGASRSNIR